MIGVLILGLAQPCRTQENLLPNPGFEEPFTAWKAWGEGVDLIARDETVAHSGKASARIPGRQAALYAYAPLSAGRAYRVTGYVKFGTGAQSGTLRLGLCAANGGNGSAGTRQVIITAAGSSEWVPFDAVIVTSRETVQSQVVLSVEGGVGWFDDLAIVPSEMPEWGNAYAAGAWDGLMQARTPRPIFAELLTKQPGHYQVTMWAHALTRSALPPPLRSGLSDANWEKETRLTFKQMGESHLGAMLLPWGLMSGESDEFWRSDRFLNELYIKYGLTFDAAAESSSVVTRAVNLGAEVLNPDDVAQGARPIVSPVDPRYVQACSEELQRLSEILAGKPYVRAVVGKDEPLVPVLPGPRSAMGPFMQAADHEVRNKYGFGKFGLPAPAEAEWQANQHGQAFSWIAFNRWMAERYAQTAKEKYELLRRLNSQWQYIPCDYWLMSGLVPFDYSRMAKYADIVQGDPYASSAERTPGRGMYNHGFGAKFLADLSQGTKGSDPKPVEIIVQAFDYAGYEVSPEDILEWCSQALRSGATSINFYASDNPRFTDPPRWQMMLHIAKTVSEMNGIARPQSTRTAILFCNAAHDAQGASCSADEVYTAYALLGEKIGCWFDIIDDLQLSRGLRKLQDYRIVYLPLATYAERELGESLKRWVEEGGILVCGDPLAFAWAPDGSDLSSLREAIFGVKVGEPVDQHAIIVHGGTNIRLPIYPRRTGTNLEFTARQVALLGAVETLGSYSNGEPALVSRDLGEGKVIYFAANPFTPPTLLGDAPWSKVIADFQKLAGEPTNLPIWRFRLPG